jgi:hypothetical protein
MPKYNDINQGIIKICTRGIIPLLLPFTIFAQGASNESFELMNLNDHAQQDGFVQAFGLNINYSPAFDGSDKYGIEVQGGGALHYKSGKNLFFMEGFDIDGVELGWRRKLKKNWIVQTGIKHETVLPTSDLTLAKIIGIPHRGSSVFMFAEVTYLLNQKAQYWITGRVATGPSDFGYRAKAPDGRQVSCYFSISTDKRTFFNVTTINFSSQLRLYLQVFQ